MAEKTLFEIIEEELDGLEPPDSGYVEDTYTDITLFLSDRNGNALLQRVLSVEYHATEAHNELLRIRDFLKQHVSSADPAVAKYIGAWMDEYESLHYPVISKALADADKKALKLAGFIEEELESVSTSWNKYLASR